MMSWIRCWSVKNVLDLYVDGRLTDEAAARVRTHLKDCPSCRREAEALAPADIPSSEVRVPEGLVDSIMDRLEEESRVPAASPWAELRLTPAQAAAMVYLLLMTGAHALPGVPSQSSGPSAPRSAGLSLDKPPAPQSAGVYPQPEAPR